MSDKQEQILQIAECMGFEARQGFEMVVIALGVSEWHEEVWEEFDPFENDGDAFKVLEALVSSQSYITMRSNSGDMRGNWVTENYTACGSTNAKTLRASICKAYLSLIQPVEGE